MKDKTESKKVEQNPPIGATCHYERDNSGEWWVVWSADFAGDKAGKKKCADSVSMEIAYAMGQAGQRQKLIEEIDQHIKKLTGILPPYDENIKGFKTWWQTFKKGE